MKTTVLQISASIFFICAALWLFSDSIFMASEQQDLIRQNAINEHVIRIGRVSPCVVELSLAAWDSMNELEIYRWITSCEELISNTEEN